MREKILMDGHAFNRAIDRSPDAFEQPGEITIRQRGRELVIVRRLQPLSEHDVRPGVDLEEFAGVLPGVCALSEHLDTPG